MTNETQQVEISAGHTPGPWAFFDASSIEDEPYFVIDTGNDRETIAEGVRNEANAHLIAAAPDLLEALEAAADVFATHDGNEDHEVSWAYFKSAALDYIIPAIRKARGEGEA